MPLHIEIVETMDYASPVTITVTQNTSTAVSAANTSRKYLRIINLSDTVMYLAIGEDAVTAKGIYLAASGGLWEMNINNLSPEAVNAICSGASKKLVVQEAS